MAKKETMPKKQVTYLVHALTLAGFNEGRRSIKIIEVAIIEMSFQEYLKL